jgi:ergothioneine biosynthesis protein EgtB
MTLRTDAEQAQVEAKTIVDQYQDVRGRTMEIVAPLEIEDYVVQTAEFMSPPRWHLGHTSWFFETLLERYLPGYEVYSREFLFFFNSYYEGFGPRIERARRGTRSRPTVAETMAYRSHIDRSMLKLLAHIRETSQAETVLPLVRLGLEHEMQHQELLVYDIKHLLCDQYGPPRQAQVPSPKGVRGTAEVEGGLFELGYSGNDFAFDNEKPTHKVYLHDFAIDRAPVSNGEFLEFIHAAGYRDYRWWHAEGWDFVSQTGWQAPLYWEQNGAEWMIKDFWGLHPVSAKADEPVSHISYYEASAFAKWSGGRLPTEGEWEKAASFDPARKQKRCFPWGDSRPVDDPDKANLFENQVWGVARIGSFPDGRSAYGCHQMIGDVWEWTNSDYVPYPGFKSEFDEYNDKWFVNQKVLRGGSFATPRSHVRATYRNFFHPHERWMISGFRCARNLSSP